MKTPILNIGDIAIFTKASIPGSESWGGNGAMITVRRAMYVEGVWYYSNVEETSIYEEWYSEKDILTEPT